MAKPIASTSCFGKMERVGEAHCLNFLFRLDGTSWRSPLPQLLVPVRWNELAKPIASTSCSGKMERVGEAHCLNFLFR